MDIVNNFNNYDFIQLGELNIFPGTKIVIMYARFMHNTGTSWTTDTHCHPFYELHFPLNGHCKIKLQDFNTITLTEGDHLLIHPNTNHTFSGFSDDFFRLSVAFYVQHNERVISENNGYIFNSSPENISELLKRMLDEYNNHNIGYKNIVDFHIQTVLIELIREYPSILHGTNKFSDTNKKIFNTSLNFIRNNISLNITSEDVAANVNLSLRQLNRIFISNSNMSVSAFIKTERISRVTEHLEKTNLPLHEIASLTGFNDEYILCKVFKKVTGETPGKYRSNYKKRENG